MDRMSTIVVRPKHREQSPYLARQMSKNVTTLPPVPLLDQPIVVCCWGD
jgi:hypothetical protein